MTHLCLLIALGVVFRHFILFSVQPYCVSCLTFCVVLDVVVNSLPIETLHNCADSKFSFAQGSQGVAWASKRAQPARFTNSVVASLVLCPLVMAGVWFGNEK